MSVEFIYFDLGNVLINFSHERQCRQLAQVAGVTPERVRDILLGDVLIACEEGRMNTLEVYEHFCEAIGSRPDFQETLLAGNDIFEINASMQPIIVHLHRAGYRLGILSNTSESHWNFLSDGRYTFLRRHFESVILSYEVGTMKPEAKIFHAAAEQAGVRPEAVFYADDIAGHVEGARAAGFDAVQYTGTPALVAAMGERGIRIDY